MKLMETENNISIDDYLEQQLGPKHLSKDIVVPITVVYIFVFISGLLGNSCVCLVIVKKNSMQTATNYYLFSLAISDLLLLIFGKLHFNFLRSSLIFHISHPDRDLNRLLKTSIEVLCFATKKIH